MNESTVEAEASSLKYQENGGARLLIRRLHQAFANGSLEPPTALPRTGAAISPSSSGAGSAAAPSTCETQILKPSTSGRARRGQRAVAERESAQ